MRGSFMGLVIIAAAFGAGYWVRGRSCAGAGR